METYLYVGDLGRGTPPAGSIPGIGVFHYEEDGSFTPVQRIPTSINCGAVVADEESGHFYITDEVSDNPVLGKSAGGRIFVYTVNRMTGELSLQQEALSYGGHPSYIALNAAKSYMITTHFCPAPPVFRLEKTADGYRIAPAMPDTTTVLRPVAPDGTLGEPSDVLFHEQEDGKPSHMHCVVKAPNKELFAACDIGLSKVYMFQIDEKNGKLLAAGNTPVVQKPGCGSRYVVFHPTEPWMFVNAEHEPIATAYRYDDDGTLTEICTAGAFENEPEAKPMASGIDISPDGRYLYLAIRGTDTVTAFDIDASCGRLTRKQVYKLQGEKPRYCRVSPDGRYLLASDSSSNLVEVMAIGKDGTLSATGHSFTEPMPGTLNFMTF